MHRSVLAGVSMESSRHWIRILGVIMFPTQTMGYEGQIPQNDHTLFDPTKMGIELNDA